MSRPYPLTVLKGGIDRLRPKGGARADSLYDLVNAQITKEFQVEPRAGTRRAASLPEGTVGLCAFGGEFHVFANENLGFTQTVFNESGTFNVPAGVTQVTVLVVGGGGGGNEGGGGAGEVVVEEAVEVTPEDTITVTVGQGGTSVTSGSSSSFGTLTALGGGRGAGGATAGQNGGSGGGGGYLSVAPGTSTASEGDGHDGGFGQNGSASADFGGGGGGAAEVGANSVGSSPGAGGDGVDVSETFGTDVGVSGFVGGGGGGGRASGSGTAAAGGAGGGGAGNPSLFVGPTSGLNHTGGGGGGGNSGSVGGSGVVVVQYNLLPDGYVLDVLLHPFDPTAELAEIHFAEPFLGALYVVAEFDDGQVYHYWLQEGVTWEADTEYSLYEFVTPTAPNGYVYSAGRLNPSYPAWAPGVVRTAGNGSSEEPSIIEPTVYNEYYYTCIATEGDPPRSGTIEPEWPTNTGQTIVENTDGFAAQGANEVTPPALPSANTPQASTTDRYEL